MKLEEYLYQANLIDSQQEAVNICMGAAMDFDIDVKGQVQVLITVGNRLVSKGIWTQEKLDKKIAFMNLQVKELEG